MAKAAAIGNAGKAPFDQHFGKGATTRPSVMTCYRWQDGPIHF